MASSHKSAEKKNAVPQFRLTEEQRGQLMEAFNLFDKDTTGKIDVVIKALGYEPNKEEIRRIIAIVDKDDTGRFDFNGFVTVMAFKMAQRDSDEEIKKSFQLFDDCCTGVIIFEDLQKAAEELGEDLTDEEIQFECDAVQMIDEADSEEQGEVTERQYFRMMKNAGV